MLGQQKCTQKYKTQVTWQEIVKKKDGKEGEKKEKKSIVLLP